MNALATELDIAYATASPFSALTHNNYWQNSKDIIDMATQSARSTPIGYPLGYILEVTNVTCACGEKSTSSRLMTVSRSGSNGRDIRYSGKSETWYDAETKTIYQDVSTPICIVCIDTAQPEKIPYINNNANLKTTIGSAPGPTLEKWLANPNIDRQGNTIVRRAKPDTEPKKTFKSILDFNV